MEPGETKRRMSTDQCHTPHSDNIEHTIADQSVPRSLPDRSTALDFGHYHHDSNTSSATPRLSDIVPGKNFGLPPRGATGMLGAYEYIVRGSSKNRNTVSSTSVKTGKLRLSKSDLTSLAASNTSCKTKHEQTADDDQELEFAAISHHDTITLSDIEIEESSRKEETQHSEGVTMNSSDRREAFMQPAASMAGLAAQMESLNMSPRARLDNDSGYRSCSGSSSPESQNRGRTHLTSPFSGNSTTNATGRFSLRAQDDHQDDQEGSPPLQPNSTGRDSDSSTSLNMRCPLYAAHPAKFSRCANMILRTPGAVNQHVTRNHTENLPIVLACSGEIVSLEKAFEHGTFNEYCGNNGVSCVTRKKFDKKPRGQSSEEYWYNLYRYVCPESPCLPIPSPYHPFAATRDTCQQLQQLFLRTSVLRNDIQQVVDWCAQDNIHNRSVDILNGILNSIPADILSHQLISTYELDGAEDCEELVLCDHSNLGAAFGSCSGQFPN